MGDKKRKEGLVRVSGGKKRNGKSSENCASGCKMGHNSFFFLFFYFLFYLLQHLGGSACAWAFRAEING